MRSFSGRKIAFRVSVRVTCWPPAATSVQRKAYGTTSAGPVMDCRSPHFDDTSVIAASRRCWRSETRPPIIEIGIWSRSARNPTVKRRSICEWRIELAIRSTESFIGAESPRCVRWVPRALALTPSS